MDASDLSPQGQILIDFYKVMAKQGYSSVAGESIEVAFSDFEIRKFRELVRIFLDRNNVRTLLDFGGGGSEWDAPGFDDQTNLSAQHYFSLDKVTKFDPARENSSITQADCVTCIDVLEHIFVADIENILNTIFTHATKCLVLNIACYSAGATLPNGENAHITVRTPDWWKGVIDLMSLRYPHVSVLLICSESYSEGVIFDVWRGKQWLESPEFTIPETRKTQWIPKFVDEQEPAKNE